MNLFAKHGLKIATTIPHTTLEQHFPHSGKIAHNAALFTHTEQKIVGRFNSLLKADLPGVVTLIINAPHK